MYTYITSGTYHFLKKIVEKHADKPIFFMHNPETALLWHETDGKSVFQAPRKYDLIASSGQFTSEGFVTLHHIPVSDDGRPAFEFGIKNRANLIDKQTGFKAIRVLRPIKSDTYIVMTLWDHEESYKKWNQSNTFDDIFKQKSIDSTTIFSGAPYVSTFVITDEDPE